MPKKIVFVFKGDEVIADAEGFIGDECVKATDKILEKLNTKIVERRRKREYYATQEQAQTIHEED